MLTFAFTTLALLIYAVAIAAAYLYAKAEFKTAFRAQARLHRKKYVQLEAKLTEVTALETENAASIKHLLSASPSSKDPLRFPSRGGILGATEDRYVADSIKAKQVTVLGANQAQ